MIGVRIPADTMFRDRSKRSSEYRRKMFFGDPHMGHFQSSGTSDQGMPGGNPEGANPLSSRYAKPHIVQTYFDMFTLRSS